jgi:hypothetical protein
MNASSNLHLNSSSTSNSNSKSNVNQKSKEAKQWKRFKSQYTLFIISIFLFVLRPFNVNASRGEEATLQTILSKSFTKKGYKNEFEEVAKIVKSNLFSNQNSSSLLSLIQSLLSLKESITFKKLYEKMSIYVPEVVGNKEFFTFFKKCVSFEGQSNTFDSNSRAKYISTLLQKKSNSSSLFNVSSMTKTLNEKLNQKKNTINSNQLSEIQSILQKLSQKFFESNTTNSKPMNTTNSKPMNTANSKPMNTTNSKPMNTTNSKPMNTTNSKPMNTTNSKPMNTANSKSMNTTNLKVANLKPVNSTNGSKVTNGSKSITNTIKGGSRNDFWWLRKYR